MKKYSFFLVFTFLLAAMQTFAVVDVYRSNTYIETPNLYDRENNYWQDNNYNNGYYYQDQDVYRRNYNYDVDRPSSPYFDARYRR